MEKLKTLQRFLCIVSHFSLFYTMHFKNTKKGKPNKKRTKANHKDWSLQSVWLGLQPSDSQFTVQIDTDYRHMICLGFAPVHIDFFFCIFPPSHPPPMAYVTWWWLVG